MATEKQLKNCDNCKYSGRPSYDYPCTVCVTAYGSAPSKWESFIPIPVDMVEVVHGYWISLTDCSNAGVYCSVCHKKVWKEDYAWCNRKNKLRSNYCPNCGAKMDGDWNV